MDIAECIIVAVTCQPVAKQVIAYGIDVVFVPERNIRQDLQQAGPESVELFAYLVRCVPDHPVLLIGLYNEDEVEEGAELAGLVEMLGRDEVIAVMAHEIGHVRRHHMPWLVLSLMAMLLVAGLLMSAPFYALQFAGVAFEEGHLPWIDGVITIGSAAVALGAFGWLSRRFELQADRYAARTIGDPEPLIAALMKLARESLMSLDPHPLLVWLGASHPPMVVRIRSLRRQREA